MVGHYCAVALCNNDREKCKEKGVTFHRFPKDSALRKEWVNKCRRSDDFNPNNLYVCSEHFQKSDFKRDLKSELLGTAPRTFLKKGAVPSLKIPHDPEAPSTSSGIRRKRKRETKLSRETEEQALSLANFPSTSSTAPEVIEDSISPVLPPLNYQKLYEEARIMVNNSQEKINALSKTLRTSKVSENVLKVKMTRLQRKLVNVNSQNQNLKRKNKTLESENQLLRREKRKLAGGEDALQKLSQVFTANEIALLTQSKNRVHWTDAEISKAFSLRYLSKRAYTYLRETLHYPLPGISSLQRWAQNIRMKDGLLTDILRIMAVTGEELNEFNKLTVLMFDEMKVDSTAEYDQLDDEIMGPYSQMQIVMARGLCGNWKQPVFVGFDTKMSKGILFDIIGALHKISYNVVAVVSDLGGGNVGLIRELGISFEKPYFSCPLMSHKICYFPDAPHLLKLIRNWFLDTGFNVEGNIIDVKPVHKLFELTRTELSVCHKLTEDHLKCEGSQRQRVKLAAQLLSHNVATALKHYVTDEESNSTAEFIQMVNDWFDILNVRVPEGYKNSFGAPYGSSYHVDEQNNLLQSMYENIFKMRCIGKDSIQLFQKGILMSINSLRLLFKEVSSTFGVKYILTAKLNQDALENLFSQLRTRGGLHDHPSPLNVIYRLRMVVLGKNVGLVQRGNVSCSGEEEFVLATVAKSLNMTTVQAKSSIIDNTSSTDTASEGRSTSHSPTELKSVDIGREASDDALMYIGGWIAKKFVGKYSLGTYSYMVQEREHTYSLPPWISHLSYGGLMVPTERFASQVRRMERLFLKYCKNSNFPKGKGVTKKLAHYLSIRMEGEFLPKEVILAFARQRLFIRVKYFNNNSIILKKKRLAKRNLTKIVKLKKNVV